MDKLKQEKIDVIFLDINLPKLKGLDFIKTLRNPPHVIIVSAYHEYALQGYEHNVIDYLLKPVEFSRFLMAVNKIKQTTAAEMPASVMSESGERSYIFFNVGKMKVKIFLDEILYIESLKEYVRIFTKTKSILTKFQLGQIESLLAKNNFIRVHRSFIVAKDKIDAFTAADIEINGKQIPVGRSYKELVQSMLDNS
jgi:DNA-binding LytR/AlgR family response regulator